MANHITINGQTYASVDQMPPDVRRQYEAAMQLLSNNAAAFADPSAGDVSISTTGSDPANYSSKTVTKMSSRRILFNGQEYARWEDVPPEGRAAFQSAGVNGRTSFAAGGRRVADARQITGRRQPNSTPSSGTSLSLITLTILLLLVLLLGMCIGHLLR